MNVRKDLSPFFAAEPPGQQNSAIRWLQKKVMAKALELPRAFKTLPEWEAFRATMRRDLPRVIGLPQFPAMKESVVRGRVRVGEDVVCERVDVYVDDDYAIPAFVFAPLAPPDEPGPGLVWSPGWPGTKWGAHHQHFALRMARKGFCVLVIDHAPFGETSPGLNQVPHNMVQVMGMGHALGISQLALRAAETMRCGEYLRGRADVAATHVALGGLCQGGMDTWLAAALDDGFCAVAPICAASTFAIHFAEMASYCTNGDSSPFPFGILNVCDVEHLHAAVAPRPLLVRINLPDEWWPVSAADDIEGFTRDIYRLYDAEAKFDLRSEVFAHTIGGVFADAFEAFLLHHV